MRARLVEIRTVSEEGVPTALCYAFADTYFQSLAFLLI
jgi:hypothetical protein